MGGLFASLNTLSGSLGVLDRAISVTQNNVNNASLPGYVRQTPEQESLPFQLDQGLNGGVRSLAPQSARNQYAERSVWRQNQGFGKFDAQNTALSDLQGLFDLTGQSGVGGSLNALAASFSRWSVSTSDSTAREDVLQNAADLAQSFRGAAAELSRATQATEGQAASTIDQINQLSAQIAQINAQRRSGGAADAGLDAQLHNKLESLSQLVNVEVRYENDGTVTALAGGQIPLVIGDQSQQLSLAKSGTVSVLDGAGSDITASVTGGTLGGLLNVRNQTLARLAGPSSQPGSLDRLAQQVADRVNQILTSATNPGPPPVAGVPLFTYDSSAAASTFAVASGFTPDQLAAGQSGPPAVANGAALQLANLIQSQDSADKIDGKSILQYFASLGSTLGSEISSAQEGKTVQSTLLAQAKKFRSDISGISLDEEATRLLELQRGYQAAARAMSIIDELTTTVINLIQP